LYANFFRSLSTRISLSLKTYSKAKFYGKHVQGQTEVNLNALGPTIRAEHHGNIEFRRHLNGINKNEKELPERRLTIRETGLIQTFPPNFIFNQKKIEQVIITNEKNYKLKYNDAINFINNNLDGSICILSNSDIYFDNSLYKI
jgi:DNA (cytosine-5)-methyltransferase 1